MDTAVAAGNFKTLAAALQAAGLVETLKGAGPFTVFAPTDEAFAALPAGTVEALLKDPSLRARFGSASRKIAAGEYSSERVAAEITRLYSRLLQQAPSSTL